MKINNKDYDISPLDTRQTVKNMIALQEKVFPDYIKFTTFNNRKIDIKLLPQILQKIQIENLQDNIQQLSKEWGINEKDIALEWIRVNIKRPLNTMQFNHAAVLKKIDMTDFRNIDTINQRYNLYITRLNDSINRLKKTVKDEKSYKAEYKKYTPIETTNFIQDSVIINYDITIDTDPLQTFDNIVLNSVIPFVHLNFEGQSYYKVLDNIIVDSEWINNTNTITFKINVEEWGTATIDYISQNNAKLTIESKVGIDSNEEYLKNNILEILNTDIKINGRKEIGIKGIFAVPEMSIDRNVFLDLITNEPIISHFLYIDEVRELSSQKSVLYIYYSTDTESSEIITAFLSEKVVSRTDPFHINKELPLFTPYLNVRISRAINVEDIDRFKTAFAIILNIYLTKYNSIVKDYNKVIPGFENDHKLTHKKATIDKKLKALQTQNPELFIHGYPTKCQKDKQPEPIQKSQIQDFENEGRQVMNYPKNTDNYYICSNNKYKFPGLLENKLNNRDAYPYLPCCYPVDQKKGNKLLNLYMQDKIKETKSKPSNIVQKKIVTRDKFGLLPRNIHYILEKFGNSYLRQGVKEGPNSFIEVILLAVDPHYENNNNKDQYILDFRHNLTNTCKSSTIAQLYDMDEKTLINNILNPDIPFDSKLYIGLLENFFKIQIIVFERSEKYVNAEYEIPRYTQGYLYNVLNPEIRTVLVYKHLGIRSDSLQYPHYELIVEKNNNIITQSFTGKIINEIYSYFLKTYKLYSIGNGRYKASDLPPITNALGQIIDKYGKCRGYLFENNIVIITSPLRPINMDIVEMPAEKVNWITVDKFIRTKKLSIIKQDIVNNKAIGVIIDLNKIPYAYIPFSPQEPIPNVDKGYNLGFLSSNEDDVIDKTVKNRKIADFLMQLVLYSFSHWYTKEPDISNMTITKANVETNKFLNESIDKFIKTKIIIEHNHNYDISKLPRKFTLNSDFFKNGSLIVDSQRTFDNLSYYLRFMVNKSIDFVKDYKNYIFLENYYTYTNDFKQNKNQLVFIGSLALTNWNKIHQQGVSNTIYNIPNPQIVQPYFFQHWALNGNKPVIMQNVQNGSLSRALAVCNNYNNNGYNSGYDTPENDTPENDKTLFFFRNGELYRNGSSVNYLWYFGNNIYSAILIP